MSDTMADTIGDTVPDTVSDAMADTAGDMAVDVIFRELFPWSAKIIISSDIFFSIWFVMHYKNTTARQLQYWGYSSDVMRMIRKEAREIRNKRAMVKW